MAAMQLRLLSGKTHKLVTAAVIYRDGDRIWHHIETPALTIGHCPKSSSMIICGPLVMLRFPAPVPTRLRGWARICSKL